MVLMILKMLLPLVFKGVLRYLKIEEQDDKTKQVVLEFADLIENKMGIPLRLSKIVEEQFAKTREWLASLDTPPKPEVPPTEESQ